MSLRPTLGLVDPDAFYAALAARQAGMDAEESLRFSARMILLLANELGDDEKLMEILAAAAAA
ncbi:MAG: DUF2783 domain-containing protein [Gammaproteobacteria bacterium]|jgi:hypothetical protein|nr:DUF2783 domain-containing protein [Gammaproteobacteria bacterium]